MDERLKDACTKAFRAWLHSAESRLLYTVFVNIEYQELTIRWS